MVELEFADAEFIISSGGTLPPVKNGSYRKGMDDGRFRN